MVLGNYWRKIERYDKSFPEEKQYTAAAVWSRFIADYFRWIDGMKPCGDTEKAMLWLLVWPIVSEGVYPPENTNWKERKWASITDGAHVSSFTMQSRMGEMNLFHLAVLTHDECLFLQMFPVNKRMRLLLFLEGEQNDEKALVDGMTAQVNTTLWQRKHLEKTSPKKDKVLDALRNHYANGERNDNEIEVFAKKFENLMGEIKAKPNSYIPYFLVRVPDVYFDRLRLPYSDYNKMNMDHNDRFLWNGIRSQDERDNLNKWMIDTNTTTSVTSYPYDDEFDSAYYRRKNVMR